MLDVERWFLGDEGAEPTVLRVCKETFEFRQGRDMGVEGFVTFRSTSVRSSRSMSDLGNDSSMPPWWLGEGALETVGLLCSEGERSCTGTLLKCSVGIRIFV